MRVLVVDDEDGVSRVGDRGVEGVKESDPLGDLTEQQSTGVGGEPAAIEVSNDGLGTDPGEVEGLAVTLCHSGGLAT